MSDDTTTWLKKNPAVNALRRSLKTSLRFHVPSSDMNTSIMSNPDKVKDQGLFIPRMLQRSNMQMRKSRAHEFKVPEMVVSKPVVKKEGLGSGVKQKKIPASNTARKSMLPVPKTKTQMTQKPTTKATHPRPSFAPGASGRRTSVKREFMKKVVELSEIKRKEEAENLKIVSGDSSVLRSILKKRASLRRTSQISSKKPKAKKVLFDGFENSEGEKENSLSLEIQNDFNTALDEPTVFLNFPNGANVDESPFEFAKPFNWTIEDTKNTENKEIDHILKLWESYKENLDSIQTERNSLENSFESLLEQNLNFQKQYQAYKESSEEMYSRLSKLGKEIEEKLKSVVAGGNVHPQASTPDSRRKSGGKKSSTKGEKIKMSEKSKVIKRNSGRKSVPLLKKEIITDMDDSFCIVSKNSFLGK